ncbi:DUF1810 domain-containing protein [Tropicimonas isoalkanivorans]|uniref:Uncharacterized protein, DUF1810 family n=1 Tax=Tropicimonas isoalkanivorans TaxID=441112 RepID=A0A1I1M330_9RHOB|nr:DUF1810 domain-containing protein [Tropicimonas isoalkanivorans]SFC77003.1 Uncharacterized protein, DUF1810 family [Tropicimonas isoalkanivorans]
MHDDTDLDRFVAAQDKAGAWAEAMAEIDAGRKRSHWIWFVYPQLRGLGRSHMATYYGIAGAEEARRYLAHPVLGPRLQESFARLMPHAAQRPENVLGEVDAMKLRSSATLFAAVASDPRPFDSVLEAFFGDERDPATLERLTRTA